MGSVENFQSVSKEVFSELRLEETLPSPVIEGLGKEILQRERR